jgi:hypothetical protein
MSTQPTQPDQRIIGELLEAFRKRNGTCLYPGCNKKPINSHVVSEKTLRLIAENTTNTILTWNLPDDTMVKRLKARLPLEQFYFEPTPVGVGQKSKVTCPLFCEDHDGPVFAPLEQGKFSSQPTPEQMLLIAYRALCTATYDQMVPERAFSVGEKYGEHSTLNRPETLPRLNRFLVRDVLLVARQRHEQLLITQDYQQIEGKTFLMNIPPCIACTDALVPSDLLDAMVTITGSQTLTAQDVVVFSFLPYPPLHNLFIISWLRGSQRARVLLNHIINPLPEKEQLEFFLSSGFQASNVYISPIWWQSLSQEQKEYYTKLHLEAGREFATYV